MKGRAIKRRELIFFGVQTIVPGLCFQTASYAELKDCLSRDGITPKQVEGPFYVEGAPRTKDLSKDTNQKRNRIRVFGKVLSRDCKPIKEAILNFWHASNFGRYDTKTFSYRGFKKSKSDGSYGLITDFPAEYFGRTPHIHVTVKVNGKELTTQLNFPNQVSNKSDYVYDNKLQMLSTPKGFLFNFIVS